MRIAVDTGGGDCAPKNIVTGAVFAARQLGVGLTLVGSPDLIADELSHHGNVSDLDLRSIPAVEVVGMNEQPVAGLRRKPGASVQVAAQTVASGDAAAFFSAGNTGATLLAARSAFGMADGIDRPALAVTIPTSNRDAVLLDVGATVDCRADNLLEFAVMGVVYAEVCLGILFPKVGLLSIGEEAQVGNELTRDAYQLLRSSSLNFVGNVEAKEVYAGRVDVIVCDGFTGNIALKVSEGLVEVSEKILGQELGQDFVSRLGRYFSRRALQDFRRRVDYSEYGGATLLGVAGLAIVGHGGSSAKAVRNAIGLAFRCANADFVSKLTDGVSSRLVSDCCASRTVS